MLRTMALVVTAAAALGCGSKPDGGGGTGASGKPRVAVSIFPLYDIARRIAGDKVDVALVLPAGKSEHSYDPTPREIAALDGVKLGLAVGLDLDTWIENILKNVGGPKVVHLGDAVDTIPIDTTPIGADPGDKDPDEVVGAKDPHVWMDPQRMTKLADAIAQELGALDPADRATFAANATAVKAALAKLDAATEARAKAWRKHAIVTFHGSMSYFAKRYGITIAAVVEPIAGKEPTAKYIASVVAAVKRGGAAAIFTEPQFERAPGETIAKEANIPLGELDPVGGTAGRETYEQLIEWNADQLEKVLK